MNQFCKSQSLLPLLDRGSLKMSLEVSLQNTSSELVAKGNGPFRSLDSSSPLFDLLHGSYRSSSGKIVKEVFLLVQKDEYSFTGYNSAFNNPEIDAIWLNAFTSGSKADGADTFDSLGFSSEDVSSPPLWRSLFYCIKQGCYFHPPCPQCGASLELCESDDTLSASQLPLYTKTAERFLFCPVCHEADGGGNFYTHNESGNLYGKESVKNRRDLIAGYQQLVEEGLVGEDFPCQNCEVQESCYSSGDVFLRLVPLSFYPFRMLVTDTAMMPVTDFNSILSGASYIELKQQPQLLKEPGRAVCLDSFNRQRDERLDLFFAGDSRCFLETLYLKIALLEQICSTVFLAGDQLFHPKMQFTLDQFWVDIPDYQGLLPSFWNITVKPVALGIFATENHSMVRVPETFGLYSLALLWYQLLLVNGEQSEADMHKGVATLLDRKEDAAIADIADQQVFAPGNIFWKPIPLQLPQPWQELWQRTLHQSWTLLKASFQPKNFSSDLFSKELNQLADDVKKTLFSMEGVPPVTVSESIPVTAKAVPPEDVSEKVQATVDSDILHILLALQDKWRSEEDPVQDEADISMVEPEPNLQTEPEANQPEPEAAQAETPPEEEQLEKTEILSAEQVAAMMDQLDQRDKQKEMDNTHQEIVTEASDTEEELEKTMIMNLEEIQEQLAKVSAGQENTVPQPEGGVDKELSETVIISSEELEKLRKGKNGNG